MKKIRKKAIIAIVCVTALWLIMGIVDFALVHNYRKPLFCVGVDLADDGGSGRYVGLGYSFEIEGNFMPDVETPATEAEKPKVTSYRGYIFGIEVSRGFWDEMLPAPYKNMNDVIENAPSLQGNVTEVHETYMIIHIVTSGYPYGADCSVTLTPVYGDSYTDVSVGDEVVVYFDGNIMETDPLQLGTVYGITLRTPASRSGVEFSDDTEKTDGECRELPDINIPILKVNDILYYGTDEIGPMGVADAIEGYIQTSVTENEIPVENEESNFGCIGNAYTKDNGDGWIMVLMDDEEWHIFNSKTQEEDAEK